MKDKKKVVATKKVLAKTKKIATEDKEMFENKTIGEEPVVILSDELNERINKIMNKSLDILEKTYDMIIAQLEDETIKRDGTKARIFACANNIFNSVLNAQQNNIKWKLLEQNRLNGNQGDDNNDNDVFTVHFGNNLKTK